MSKRGEGRSRRAEAPPPPKALGPMPTRIKILSLGSSVVGKSCLIKRYCEDRFVSKYITTIGVDYGVKPVEIEGVDVKVNFWDLSGHPEFFEIRNEFYKDAQGVLLVFDLSNLDSFEDLDDWLAEALKYGANPRITPFVLVGNKNDRKRVVAEDDARTFAQNRGLTYVETSASTGHNVHEMFLQLFQNVVVKCRS